ncbi:hypothetical protein HK101_004339, partial [Irineochytrium annulatum]
MYHQSSPTPSSNASVIASEGEEEGFDDIEFPEALEPRSTASRAASLLQTQAQTAALAGTGDDDVDPTGDLLIPDDFSWGRHLAPNAEIGAGASRFTPELNGRGDASSPSKIPILRPRAVKPRAGMTTIASPGGIVGGLAGKTELFATP